MLNQENYDSYWQVSSECFDNGRIDGRDRGILETCIARLVELYRSCVTEGYQKPTSGNRQKNLELRFLAMISVHQVAD